MKRSGVSTLAGMSLLCLFILAACNCAPTLRYLTVTPPSATISAGTTQQFTATTYFSDGTTQNVSSTATWSSSNTAVATIDSNGVATGVGAGTTTIAAVVNGFLSAKATLTVNALQSIVVTPANSVIAVGATQQFTATGTFLNADGTTGTTDITSQVTWSSSKPTVATIDNAGLATAVANGVTVISAALNGVTGTTNLSVGAAAPVSLQITPANPTAAIGNATTFTVQEVYSDTTVHPVPAGTQIDWTSGTLTTATLANASSTTTTNISTALAVGTTVITATENGTSITGNTTLTVVTGSTHFAYMAINGASEIEWYSVNAASTTPLSNPQKLSVPQPQQVVLSPGSKYLYSVDVSSVVTTYSVSATSGSPTSTGSSTLAGVGGLNYAVIDPYGRFMYVADDGSNNGTDGSLAGFTINADGSLTGISGMTPTAGSTPSPFTTNLDTPTGLVIDRSGAYLYVINNGFNDTSSADANTVAAFSIDQTTGALTPLSTATVATGNAPYLGSVDGNKHLYVANSVDNTVSAFTIGSNGVLTQIGATNFAVSGTPSPVSVENVLVDPSGTHIYVVDGGDSALTPPANTGFIYAFSLNSDGSIGSAISGSPYATGVFPPGGMAIDPTGALLGVENNGDGTISPFKIGGTGALTPDAAVTTDQFPLFITFYNAP